jgi:hypothetical protein
MRVLFETGCNEGSRGSKLKNSLRFLPETHPSTYILTIHVFLLQAHSLRDHGSVNVVEEDARSAAPKTPDGSRPASGKSPHLIIRRMSNADSADGPGDSRSGSKGTSFGDHVSAGSTYQTLTITPKKYPASPGSKGEREDFPLFSFVKTNRGCTHKNRERSFLVVLTKWPMHPWADHFAVQNPSVLLWVRRISIIKKKKWFETF